ncbi:MAG: 23S rRNA (uracil(1939)-C(5))-methyltransferase RlmD [Betaproteobacteria bacterium]|nr:MAG: 23S rRNA (uracil(1939)-C(5))-methyltransferase RlmD [Betaproteobacteria bacterium]
MTLEVVALDAEGRGVARNPDGKVVFVEGALAGEIVAARLVRSQRSFDLMRTTAVLRQSSGRRAPRCAYFGVCGGCATQHADARTQVAAKQRWLEDCLQRIGKVEPGCILAPIHGEEWGYRRRARLSVRYLISQGVAMVGFRERKSTFVADMDGCEVLPPQVAALIPGLRRLVASLSIRDRLPQIEVAVGDEAVALVFRHLLPLAADDESKLREFAQESGVWVWLQPGGPDSAHPFAPAAAGALHYALPEFGVRIEFRPTDFTQVNHGVNRLLVARAVRLLDPQPGERIADLFCGLGNFALPVARCGAQVTGFEGSAGLVERARQNAALNGLEVRFASADLARGGIGGFGPFDKLLLDPPREGAVELIKALPPDWPRRIVYVSCDPATLARDASVLVHTKGFALAAASVVNMFPHTAHVESIALFER